MHCFETTHVLLLRINLETRNSMQNIQIPSVFQSLTILTLSNAVDIVLLCMDLSRFNSVVLFEFAGFIDFKY